MNSTKPVLKTFFYPLAFGGRSPLLDSIESASSNYSSLIFLGDKELPDTPIDKVDCPYENKELPGTPLNKVDCPYNEKNSSQPLPALIPSCCFATVGSRQL